MNWLSLKYAMYVLAWSAFGATGFSQEPVPTPDYKQLGRRFVLAKFAADRESLVNAFAPDVLLLPNHEYLKPEYGLNPDGDRRKSINVKRDVIVDLDVKVYSTFPVEKKAKIKDALANCEYKFVITERVGTTLNPHELDDREQASLFIPTRQGDVVMIVLLKPKEEYCLYVMRKIDGVWKIIMDYTD